MNARSQLGVFLVSFAIILALGSREPPWTDARQIWAVAESIVDRGAVDIKVSTGLGREGKNYGVHPLLPSLIHVPGVALERAVVRAWPGTAKEMRPLASHLGPALVGALGALLFLQLLLDLTVRPRLAVAGALALTTSTMMLVYARSPYTEITQATCFLGCFLWLLRLLRDPRALTAVGFGAWAGLLVNSKALFALALPGAALLGLALVYRRHGRRGIPALIGWVAAGAAPLALMFFLYNQARTGASAEVGYPTGVTAGREFQERLVVGLWGLFLSPGKSLFLYNPPLIAGLLALPRVLREYDRDWAWAALATAGPVILFYARTTFWHGDWCWGPRYLIFAVPLLLLPLVLWANRVVGEGRGWRPLGLRLRQAAAAGLVAAGFGVQLLGAAFYWDHYLRIDHDVRPQWLGRPNRSGAISPDRGGWCDPCVEDLYGVNWLPAFSPLEGHWWLLRHVPFDHPVAVAGEDAPWRRYTAIPIDLSRTYPRARIDWWLLDYDKERAAGALLLGAMLALGAGGTALLLWRPRRREAAGPAEPARADSPG